MEDSGVYRMLKRLYDSENGAGSVKSVFSDRHPGSSKLGRVGKKQRVYSIIHRLNVLNLPALAKEAEKEEVCGEELDRIIADLKARGLIYEPEPGFLGCAGD